MMRFIKQAFALCLAMLFVTNIVCAVPTTSPQVASFLKNDIVSFLTNVPAGYDHYVTFTVASNQEGKPGTWEGGLVAYTKGGNLKYDASTGTLTGEGTQYFSSNTYTCEVRPANLPPNQLWLPTMNPFDPKNTNKVRWTFNVKDGSAKVTLLSWGNSVIPLTYPEYQSNTRSITGATDMTEQIIIFQKWSSRKLY